MQSKKLIAGLFMCWVGITQGAIWYVDDDAPIHQDGTCWSSAFRTLQQALNKAQEGDVIYIAQGVYTFLDTPVPVTRESVPMFDTVDSAQSTRYRGRRPAPTHFLVQKPLTLRGGFPGLADPCAPDQWNPEVYTTVIRSGEPMGGDTQNVEANARHLIEVNVELGKQVTLDGLHFCDAKRSAVLLYSGHFVIRDCWFENNRSVTDGAGIYCGGSSEVILDCERCVFVGNQTFASGAAIFYTHGTNLRIAQCRFYRNSAMMSGGAVYGHGTTRGVLTNCLFSGNSAAQGGGAYWGAGSITNCTFAANGPQWGLVLTERMRRSRGESFRLKVTNSILWNDGGYAGSIIPSDELSMAHSLVYSVGWEGPGNLAGDPCFVDAYGPDGVIGTVDDDLRLQPGSPAGPARNAG